MLCRIAQPPVPLRTLAGLETKVRGYYSDFTEQHMEFPGYFFNNGVRATIERVKHSKI